MWPYPWTHVGTPSHLGQMDRVAATMPSQAHAGAAQEAPNIGQGEEQDVPLVRPSKEASRAPEDTYLPTLVSRHFFGKVFVVHRSDLSSLCALVALQSIQFDLHCFEILLPQPLLNV